MRWNPYRSSVTVLIEVLYVVGCPNLALVRQRLQEAAVRSGVDVSVCEREINEAQDAESFGMRGSPTILVDGCDAVPTDASASLSCRLYRTDAGAG